MSRPKYCLFVTVEFGSYRFFGCCMLTVKVALGVFLARSSTVTDRYARPTPRNCFALPVAIIAPRAGCTVNSVLPSFNSVVYYSLQL